ncbi:Tlg2-vesicle protein [Malassezia sp. CBS 17886]|nr:Tlg2-vesicle protein [Malassezia sp. CBS 17886]
MDAVRQHVVAATRLVSERIALLTPLQRKAIAALVVLHLVGAAVVVYVGSDALLHTVAVVATWVASSPLGVPFLFTWMAVSGFPPLSGFVTAVTLCGMAFSTTPRGEQAAAWADQAYAMLRGWGIASLGMFISGCINFFVLRAILHHASAKFSFIQQVKRDARFRALQDAVREQGLKMTIMSRYSLDSVSLSMYLLSTAAASPRLLVHVFLGAKMYELMNRDVRAKMDTSAKVVNVVSIVASMVLGILCSWSVHRAHASLTRRVIWRRTSALLHLNDPLLGEDDEVRIDDEVRMGNSLDAEERGGETDAFVLEERGAPEEGREGRER